MRYTILLGMILFVGCSSAHPKETAFSPAEAGKIGPSKTIVFVHGMFVTPASWENWKKYFEAKGFKVYAPAWPYHDTAVSEQVKAPDPKLPSLSLDVVIATYRDFIKTLPEKPILIGHSMGGLVTQVLASEGVSAGAIAIDSAPTKGLIVFKWSFFKSNWGHISPFSSMKEPEVLSQNDFNYAFVNGTPEHLQKQYYETFAVPESKLVGKGPTTDAAAVEFSKKRGPLLMIAGENDHIIPAKLTWKNYSEYEAAKTSLTSFKEFPERNHFLVGDERWMEVADYVVKWIEQNR